MSKHRLKLLLAGSLLAVAAGVLLAGLGGAGRLLAHFGSGADPSRALHEVSFASPDGGVVVEWLADLPQPARAIEPATREAVTDAYLRAWDDIAAGAPDSHYLTGPAALAAGASDVDVRHLSHALQLEFYSADGQVLVMADAAAVARVVPAAGNRLLVMSGTERLRVIMLLEDGNWRIRSLTRLEAPPPRAGLVADPRPDVSAAVAAGALVVGLLSFMPGRRRRPGPPNPERN